MIQKSNKKDNYIGVGTFEDMLKISATDAGAKKEEN
jgi:hypothetical protein